MAKQNKTTAKALKETTDSVIDETIIDVQIPEPEVEKDVTTEVEVPAEAEAPVIEPEPLEDASPPKTSKGKKKIKPEVEIVAPEDTISADPDKVLEAKIKAIVPNIQPRTLARAIYVNKVGGTVAILNQGNLVFLPSHHPDKGGRASLSRSSQIKAFVADL